MKKIFVLLLLAIGFQSNSQSLKDALFGGKLKNDSNSVIRKTDDLSTKIDTARKKPVETEKPKAVVQVVTADSVKTPITPAATAAISKDNNKNWKEFMDTVITTLNAEVMGSKQLKKGDYFIIVDYAIDTDGSVTVTNVLPTPENKFLADQVKERVNIAPPKLNPMPRKTFKRYSFTISSK